MSEAVHGEHLPETYTHLGLADGMRDLLADPAETGELPTGYDDDESELGLRSFRAGTYFTDGIPLYRVAVQQRGDRCYYMRMFDEDWGYDFLPTVLISNEGSALFAGHLPPEIADEATHAEFLLFILQSTDFNLIDTKLYEEMLRRDMEETIRLLNGPDEELA
jgi:hypothetical protein